MKLESYDKYDFFNKDNHFKTYKDIESIQMYGKKKDDAEISIVMPVYKRTAYICEAIDSAINQKTRRIYNIIIVDNTAENDSIFYLVKSYPEDKIVYYKNEQNIGMFGNWNRCIELADTPWIAMLHDDDKLKPNYIETIMNAIDTLPDCSGVGVELEMINDKSEVINTKLNDGEIELLSTLDFYFSTCPVNIEGFAFKRDIAMGIGGFDENFYPAADSNYICKMHVLYGSIYKVDKALVQYRIAANESANPNVLRQMVMYCYAQNKVLLDYVGLLYKILYNQHQNMVIQETIKSHAVFKTDCDYQEVKDFLNFRFTMSVKIYTLLVRFLKPHLMKRLVRRIKNKIGG